MKAYIITIYLYSTLVVCSFILIRIYQSLLDKKSNRGTSTQIIQEHPIANMKYILQWTSPKTIPFAYMGVGSQVFVEKRCYYTNCFVTSDRSLLRDYTKFDVIAFAGPQAALKPKSWLPRRRSPHQKYVFASIESPGYYPICSDMYDGYFNWTWTYRLDSDARWGFLAIKDEKGNIVGPNKDMKWIDKKHMRPVTPELMSILRGKTKTAAWFVSHCITQSDRESFVLDLQRELKKYNLTIDTYGLCGTLNCSRDDEKLCNDMIEKDYYFYLSLENSFGEDYVTEKLLHAVRYSAIPIVYGDANYSRFLPRGSYLNARELDVRKLAKRMYELMHDFEQYSSYFKWRNHYSYHARAESADTDDYCGICALLNDKKKLKQTTIYHQFQKWWGVNPFWCDDVKDVNDEIEHIYFILQLIIISIDFNQQLHKQRTHTIQ